MSDFTAITSQEQLDAVIGDRLKRSEEKWQKKYEGYISPDDFNAKTSDLQKQLTDATNALIVSSLSPCKKSTASYDNPFS